MNIDRLKYAWARGARLQSKPLLNPVGVPEWTDMGNVWPMSFSKIRIHPEDEELQYGPLSSALRELVIEEATPRTFHSITGYLAARYPELAEGWWDLEGEARVMQWLFLAELLADEGL